MLRRLADDSADVVAVALRLPMLHLVPPAALFEALASIVSRPSMPEKRRSAEDLKSQRGSARKVRDTAGARPNASRTIDQLLVLPRSQLQLVHLQSRRSMRHDWGCQQA